MRWRGRRFLSENAPRIILEVMSQTSRIAVSVLLHPVLLFIVCLHQVFAICRANYQAGNDVTRPSTSPRVAKGCCSFLIPTTFLALHREFILHMSAGKASYRNYQNTCISILRNQALCIA